MSGRIAALVVLGIAVGAGYANAQESTPGPGVVEVTYMPAGAAFFTSEGDAPSFGNYGFGTAVTFNANRVIGIEAGSQLDDLDDVRSSVWRSEKSAQSAEHAELYANVVVDLWPGDSVAPHATVGIGGHMMFKRPSLGVLSDETFLTGNVGGGIKWYAPNNRWGWGDDRFAASQSKNDALAFFGRDTRYVHRVYAAVIINTAR